MKKLALLFISFICALYASAQEIEVDKVEQNGTRFIFCSEINPNKLVDSFKIFPYLSTMMTKEGATVYNLIIRIPSEAPISIKKGSVILLKTFNDEIITLYCNSDYEDKIGKYIGGALHTTVYNISPSYTIEEIDIERFRDGIKKIRVEFPLETKDKEFSKDKFGKHIYTEYELIKEALTKKKDITDGF